MPDYCKVGSGEIHDSKGNISNQTDLIIYNNNILPPILFDSELGVFTIESVIYAIEIKSTSTNNEIKTTIEKFQNLKSLSPIVETGLVMVYFAYKSDLSVKNELQRYLENDSPWNPSIYVICVGGDGYYYYNYIDIYEYELCIDGKWEKHKGSRLVQWLGIKARNYYEIMAFISGIFNTTRGCPIGQYVLDYESFETYYEAILDYNGEPLYENVNYDGIPDEERVKIYIR